MGYHHLFGHAQARLVINQAVLPLRTVNNGCLLTLSYVVSLFYHKSGNELWQNHPSRILQSKIWGEYKLT